MVEVLRESETTQTDNISIETITSSNKHATGGAADLITSQVSFVRQAAHRISLCSMALFMDGVQWQNYLNYVTKVTT